MNYPEEIEELLVQDDLDFLREAFRTLTKIEKELLSYRFGLGRKKQHTLAETAHYLYKKGYRYVSRSRIGQIQKAALKKLRAKFEESVKLEEKPKGYLEVLLPIRSLEEIMNEFYLGRKTLRAEEAQEQERKRLEEAKEREEILKNVRERRDIHKALRKMNAMEENIGVDGECIKHLLIYDYEYQFNHFICHQH